MSLQNPAQSVNQSHDIVSFFWIKTKNGTFKMSCVSGLLSNYAVCLLSSILIAFFHACMHLSYIVIFRNFMSYIPCNNISLNWAGISALCNDLKPSNMGLAADAGDISMVHNGWVFNPAASCVISICRCLNQKINSFWSCGILRFYKTYGWKRKTKIYQTRRKKTKTGTNQVFILRGFGVSGYYGISQQ